MCIRDSPMMDPAIANPSHKVCEAESDNLRDKNLKLKVQLDRLWAKAAHLESQLREVKPSRYPLGKVRHGRPSRGAPRYGDLAAEVERFIGLPLPKVGGTKPEGRYLNRQAMEAIVRMLHEADECRLLHQAGAA